MEMQQQQLQEGGRLQTDYASHECRANFFEQCKKSGMNIRQSERARTWETEETNNQSHRDKFAADGGRPAQVGRVERGRSCDSPRLTANSGSRR